MEWLLREGTPGSQGGNGDGDRDGCPVLGGTGQEPESKKPGLNQKKLHCGAALLNSTWGFFPPRCKPRAEFNKKFIRIIPGRFVVRSEAVTSQAANDLVFKGHGRAAGVSTS